MMLRWVGNTIGEKLLVVPSSRRVAMALLWNIVIKALLDSKMVNRDVIDIGATRVLWDEVNNNGWNDEGSF